VLSLLKIEGHCLKGFVGGQDNRTAFVALADDLKE